MVREDPLEVLKFLFFSLLRAGFSVFKEICCCVPIFATVSPLNGVLSSQYDLPIIKLVPLPILKRFDISVIVAATLRSCVNQNSKELINKLTVLQIRLNQSFSLSQFFSHLFFIHQILNLSLIRLRFLSRETAGRFSHHSIRIRWIGLIR